MNYRLTYHITPYVRMTQRSKFVNPQAKEYLASKEAIQWQIKPQMGLSAMMPRQASLRVDLHFQLPSPHACDLDNLIKAVCDALQGVAIHDDRWIDEIHATAAKGEHLTNIMVTLRD